LFNTLQTIAVCFTCTCRSLLAFPSGSGDDRMVAFVLADRSTHLL
jgi:hypothetical protein